MGFGPSYRRCCGSKNKVTAKGQSSPYWTEAFSTLHLNHLALGTGRQEQGFSPTPARSEEVPVQRSHLGLEIPLRESDRVRGRENTTGQDPLV